MSNARPRQVDRPERDPNAMALGDFDVTSLSIAEMDSYGVKIVPGRLPAEDGIVWVSHSELAGMDPQTDAADRKYARLHALDHIEAQRRRVGCPVCKAHPGRPCRGGTAWAYSPYVHALRRELAHRDLDITLAGLTLTRTFPCVGMLRRTEIVAMGDKHSLVMVCCDQCGFETAVRFAADDPEPKAEPF